MSLYDNGIIKLGCFEDLANYLKLNIIEKNNIKKEEYCDSSKRGFLVHCKLTFNNKELINFINNQSIFRELSAIGYYFRNKIDVIRWKSSENTRGAHFYHHDGLDGQLSLMMLLSDNYSSSRMYFANKSNKGFLIKYYNFFYARKYKNKLIDLMSKKFFRVLQSLYNYLVNKNYLITKIEGVAGETYLFNAGDYLHKAENICGSTRDILHINLTKDPDKVIEKHQINLNEYSDEVRKMFNHINI
jgi:hypothetical protein